MFGLEVSRLSFWIRVGCFAGAHSNLFTPQPDLLGFVLQGSKKLNNYPVVELEVSAKQHK